MSLSTNPFFRQAQGRLPKKLHPVYQRTVERYLVAGLLLGPMPFNVIADLIGAGWRFTKKPVRMRDTPELDAMQVNRVRVRTVGEDHD